MANFATMAVLLLATPFEHARASTPVDVQRKVETVLRQMTPQEKIDLLGGVNFFDIRGVPRLGVPIMSAADGPFGVSNYARSNAMAGGIALAATWNTDLAEQVGREMGRDSRARGVHFFLAPGVNIYRSPLNGRNFEYLGEDPHLASRIAVGFIHGVQGQGVAATVKHYLGNNSEFARHTTDAVIDERTLREIYMPAFEAAVKEGNVAAVMDSYNLVNGEHATQNGHMNVDVLKREWGFAGVLMSDWGATYDTLGTANGGLDLEMPFGQFFSREKLLPLIESGKVSQATIDDKVRRILRTAVRLGWLDRDQLDPSISLYNRQGRQVALQTAREGIVLLKNEKGTLPLDRHKVRTLAVIGPNAYPAVPYGGGSSTVAPFHSISLLEGLGDHLDPDVDVQYARGIPDLHRMAIATNFSTAAAGGQAGVKLETFANNELAGPAVDTHIELHIDQGAPPDLIPLATGDMDFSALMSPPKPVSMRWTGFYTPTSAVGHDIFLQFGGFSESIGHRLYVDDKLIVDRWGAKFAVADSTRLTLDRSPHKIVLEYRGESGGFGGAHPFVRLGIVPEGKWVDAATERLAARADAVVLAVGFDTDTETEDWDRSFHLPPGQEELIRRISAANGNTIVVVTSGGAVAANDWLERVPALLQAWYPGQEGGRAIAEILFGDVNPSGKLPATFERRWEDNPVHDSYYADPATHRVAYKEGVFVGYRGYERNGTKPLYAFGHGLSYTTFKYDGLDIERQADASYKVSFAVTNTGNRAGAAVPQLYVADGHAKVPRPPKELKGFTKVMLQPGEARTVVIPLDSRAFSYYDVADRRWRADAGTFGILIGSSSDRIELKGEVALPRSIRSK